MPKKPTIIVRAADGSRREVRPKRRKAPKSKARPKLTVIPDRWASYARQQARLDKRAAIDNPERTDLTKGEWIERGDLIRIARINGVQGARSMSLADLRQHVPIPQWG